MRFLDPLAANVRALDRSGPLESTIARKTGVRRRIGFFGIKATGNAISIHARQEKRPPRTNLEG
jgi:hypothetical protein